MGEKSKVTISFSLVMQINKEWRQQEIHKTYQQTNWKWQGATETVSASTLGPLGIVSVWPDSAGLPCFSAISISHSCQDRLRGGSDLFSQMMFLCGFVPVQTVYGWPPVRIPLWQCEINYTKNTVWQLASHCFASLQCWLHLFFCSFVAWRSSTNLHYW